MMRNLLIVGVAAMAVACGSSSNSGSSLAGNSAASPIAVIGCLQPADQAGSPVGTSGTVPGTGAAGVPGDRFVLTNARTGDPAAASDSPAARSAPSTAPPASGSAAVSESGTAGTSGSAYSLEGKTSELRDHANTLVRISGRLDSSSGTEQRLHVDSVTMIASSCASQ